MLTHEPVLLSEVVRLLAPAFAGRPQPRIIDGTLGLAGHARALLAEAGAESRLLGLDQDAENLDHATASLSAFGQRATVVWSNFDRMNDVASGLGFDPADAILLDLGVSSPQLDDPIRGFSFMGDGPLDMRMNLASELSAAQLVNHLPEAQLADLIYAFGEERHSRRIARAIVARRPIHTTRDLVAAIRSAVPRRPDEIHPATRTFQAIRIAVNDELDRLRAVLPQAIALLRPGGRLAVISFHSLEDRIVKEFFRREASDCICPPQQPVCTCDHRPTLRILTKKVVVASEEEVGRNPRARSAKLRVAERL